MTTESNLVLQALSLSAVEREELAAALWQSLIEDPAAPADPMLDPDGISLALQRDREIDAERFPVVLRRNSVVKQAARMKLEFHPGAASDLNEAVSHYEAISSGLGQRCREEVYAAD